MKFEDCDIEVRLREFFVEYFAFDLIVDDEKMCAMHRHVHERKNATEVVSFGAAVQAAILTGEGGLHRVHDLVLFGRHSLVNGFGYSR